jgi:O-antigen ligase
MSKLNLLLFRVFLVALFLGQLGRLPIPGGAEGGLYLHDVVLGVLLVCWITWRLVVQKKIVISPVDIVLFIFAGTTFVSLLYSLTWIRLDDWLVSSFYWFRLAAYLFLYQLTVELKEQVRSKFAVILPLLITFFATAGLLQFLVFPDFSKYVQHGWDPHYYRVLSTFFDPNYAGLFLVFGFLYLLNVLYKQFNQPQTLQTSIILTQVLLVGAALTLTFSRSSYLAYALAMLIFAWFKDKRIIFMMIIFGVIIFATVPRVRNRVVGALNLDQTAQLRLLDYQKSWQIIQDHPILGVGFNTLRYAKEEYGLFRDKRGVNQPSGHAGAGADNSFLFIWSTGGIISLISLLGVLIFFVWQSWFSPDRAFLLATLAAWVVHAQFVNSLFYIPILSWVLVMLGIHLHHHDKPSA